MNTNKLMKIFANHKRLIWVLFVALMLQFLVGLLLFFIVSIDQIHTRLDRKIQQIKTDVQFENDVWDLTLYNNDPNLLGTDPLYFIASDGLVLDRRSPIRGFLDTSDFKKLLSYTSPQTIKNVTGNLRRVYAKPIIDQDKPVGVVAVSYYNPSDKILDQIDKKLVQTADDILTKIVVHQGVIDIGNLDVRKIPYDISFTIVDAFNGILTKTANVNSFDRIPNFIDPSYVKKITTLRPTSIVRDTQTHELFLVKIAPIIKNSNLVAIVAVGLSISSILSAFHYYFVLGGLVALFLISWAIYMIVSAKTVRQIDATKEGVVRNQASFSEKRGKLMINGIHIKIPYATNQYYLLKMLFSKPSKRWETDELLDRFGEDSMKEKSRKVYDAMVSVNKKVLKVVTVKLILNQNKTYQLNQDFSISS